MIDDAHVQAVLDWRRERENSLRKENGWLALAGLFWLKPGHNTAGSDPASDIRLPPRLPALVGYFDRDGGSVAWRPVTRSAAGTPDGPPAAASLRSDVSEEPTPLDLAGIRMMLIDRGGRLAVRVWDNLRPERSSFPPRTWFQVDPAFRMPATYLAYAERRKTPAPDVSGATVELPIDGSFEFNRAGIKYRLDATREEDGSFVIHFLDHTAQDRTYPSGRYLVVSSGDATAGVLDFNFAYNPPCAFTPFATCIFAPVQNRLDFRVEAGETYERH